MLSGYTIFVTYGFETIKYSTTANKKSYGYSQPIYCNYIQKLYADNLINKNINFYFLPTNNFPFLVNNITSGSGWTANKIYTLVQIVNNQGYSKLEDIKPLSDQWKYFNISNQMAGFVNGNTINPTTLISTPFSILLSNYNNADNYNLNYLNYPLTLPQYSNDLGFGEETFFFGDVSTDIQAIAYTSDIVVNLPLNEFNSSTNLTWDGTSSVQISEVGIYDDAGNLVAIGKFNDPISKDQTISRTIVFGIDF